jgi:selenocysteine lyase/cysteine desulfurase
MAVPFWHYLPYGLAHPLHSRQAIDTIADMDWTHWRTHFPIAAHWAFLDHAAVAPLPAPAVQAIRVYADRLAVTGAIGYADWHARGEQVRGSAARLLGAEAADVAFVANTTAGVVIVAEGFPWQAGDNVVTAAEEYPTNQYPWLNLASRGVALRRVPSRGSRIAIDDLRAAIDERTRVVTLSFVEYASGFRNDLETIGSLCRERGIFFFVDAIQGLGVLPLDVSRLPVDALAADGHKWLLGPEGLGLFWCRRAWLDRLHPIGVGWNSVLGSGDFSRIDFRLKPNAGRFEGGTMNFAGITGLGASLELLEAAGYAAVGERILFLTDHLCEQAARAGLSVFSSRAEGERSGIVALDVPGLPASEASRRCQAAGIAANVRAGHLRVSPHAYNSIDELDRLIDVLREATP